MKDVNPGTLFKLSSSYWGSCTLHAGLKLNVFTEIGQKPMAAADLAIRLGADERGLTALLNALVALNLLTKRKNCFGNAEISENFLMKDSVRYVGHLILHHAQLMDSWRRLDEAVLSGKPVRSRSSFGTDSSLEHFLLGMHIQAMGIAPWAAANFDLSGRRRLLDVGGGPGTWAIHFALNHPELTATIFDLPSSRPFAERTISQFGVDSRVRFVGGDFNHDDLPSGFDVAWLSHILHGEGPDNCANIIRKAVRSVGNNGLILIHEFILDDARTSPTFPALFSLNMLTGTPAGRSYTQSELEKMLLDAGVSEVSMLAFRGPSESRILAAVV